MGPFSCEYYSSFYGPVTNPDQATINPTEPFFDLDPVPMVVGQAGYTNDVDPDGQRLIPIGSFSWSAAVAEAPVTVIAGATHYPEGGVAAFKPGRGFRVYSEEFDAVSFWASFDFVMLPD